VGYYGLELVPGYHEASLMLDAYCTIESTVQIFDDTETELDTMLMICTNIQKFDDLGVLKISPNPVTSQAVLSLNLSTSIPIEICIYNTSGICLKSWQFKNQQPDEKAYKLDIKDLPEGVYFCRIQIGNETVTKKIIKVK